MNRDDRNNLVDALHELTTHGISDDAVELVKKAIAAIESPMIELSIPAARLLAKTLESASDRQEPSFFAGRVVASVACHEDQYSPVADVWRSGMGVVAIEVRQHWS